MVNKKEDFYSISGRSEIDLRSEFGKTLQGSFPEIPKKQTGLQRIFRLQDGKKIKCSCVDPVTSEPDKERRCNICLGEGYLWDESYIEFYYTTAKNLLSSVVRENLHEAGTIITDSYVFYIESRFNLTKDDKLLILVLDKEGKVVLPVRRKRIFRITQVQEMRLDNGRLEFWKLATHEETNKHL